MKIPDTFTTARLALITALMALPPAFGEDAPATTDAEVRAEAAEAKADAHRASLDQINASIDAIEARIENAPDDAEKTAAETRLKALKERRAELRKNFIKAKADELVADLKVESDKVAAWTKRTYENVKDKVTGSDDDEPGVIPTARAALDPDANTARAEIEFYRLNPSPENKADVKRALKALDQEIDRLDDHADTLPKGEKRDALKQRVKALEAREKELKRDFTKARWDALVDDLRASWNSLVD